MLMSGCWGRFFPDGVSEIPRSAGVYAFYKGVSMVSSAQDKKKSRSPSGSNFWPGIDVDRADNRERTATVAAALVFTVVIHGAFALVMPWDAFSEQPAAVMQAPAEIEFVLQPPPMPEFVEANPMAPEEAPPPDTLQESDRDQVAAQEDPDPDSSDARPTTDGLEDSQKIVDGNLEEEPPSPPPGQPVAVTEPVLPTEVAEPVEAVQPPEVMEPEPATPAEAPEPAEAPPPPAADALALEPLTDDGVAATLDETAEAPEWVEQAQPDAEPLEDPATTAETAETAEVVAEAVEATEPSTTPVEPSPPSPEGVPSPRPRPQLSMRSTPGPIAQNTGRASRMGMLAVDSRFTEFGAYQQRMIEAIAQQWNQLGRRFPFTSRDHNTRVVISFMLDKEGRVTRLEVIDTTSSDAATLLVGDAILSRAPFGEWTREMLSTLGDEPQEVRITFHYQ